MGHFTKLLWDAPRFRTGTAHSKQKTSKTLRFLNPSKIKWDLTKEIQQPWGPQIVGDGGLVPSKIEWYRIPTDPDPYASCLRSQLFFDTQVFFVGSVQERSCWRFLGLKGNLRETLLTKKMYPVWNDHITYSHPVGQLGR